MQYSKLMFAPLVAATLAFAGCTPDEPAIEEDVGVAEEDLGIAEEPLADDDVMAGDFATIGFGDLDADATGDLTMEEFDEWGEGLFNEWDADADAELTEDELPTEFTEAGMFEEWDLNDDMAIDEEEFDEGLFGVFDENADDTIAEDEWNTVYGAWDWGF